MIFVDSNIPMYLVGAPHPNKDAARAALERIIVTDARLAALAIESGCELVTTDRDFARFEGLRWRHPIALG